MRPHEGYVRKGKRKITEVPKLKVIYLAKHKQHNYQNTTDDQITYHQEIYFLCPVQEYLTAKQ